jgi:hypothetical protein
MQRLVEHILERRVVEGVEDLPTAVYDRRQAGVLAPKDHATVVLHIRQAER